MAGAFRVCSGGEVCACQDTGTHVLLSHTSTVPAQLQAPTSVTLAKAFTEHPVKVIWGLAKVRDA